MIATPTALLPADEAGRLHTLHRYDILRSLQEEVFDELVAFAAQVFQLPIAYISLIGQDEAAYKAAYGFPVLAPQPRVNMLCAVAVREGHVVVYQDLEAAIPTATDAAAIRHALANRVRFYAGAPLRMPSQHNIGALCLVGQQPRVFSPEEQAVLGHLANIVSLTIAVRHLCLNYSPLGNDCWYAMQTQLRDEVYALTALARYLAARYGTSVPVPTEILQPVVRRLNDLRDILKEYQQD